MSQYQLVCDRLLMLNRFGACDDSNVEACVQDAWRCMISHIDETPFPRQGKPSTVLPNTWLESALMWTNRAAQHAFGFNVPDTWPKEPI